MTTVIIKPTDGCNARCRYCSAAHPGQAKRMTLSILSASFHLFADWARRYGHGRLCFIWHGGEPLLMPRQFWKDVRAMQRDIFGFSGISVVNRMQTNLTCLTPELADELKQLLGDEGVVGTSADPLPGVRELAGHPVGAYRDRWERSLELLAERRIRYGIIYVIHRASLDHLGELYRYFRREHPEAGIRFNALYRQGRARDDATWEDLGVTAEQWGTALQELYRFWTADGRPANVQPFGPWWQLYSTGTWRLSCEFSGTCFKRYFGVDPAGNVYLCGRSADGGALRFGAVKALTAETLRSHPLRQQLANRSVYLRRTFCRDCRWWLYCHGGCVNDSLVGHGTPFAPTSLCTGLRRFFDRAFAGSTGERTPCVA